MKDKSFGRCDGGALFLLWSDVFPPCPGSDKVDARPGYSDASCPRSWMDITLARIIQDDDTLGGSIAPIIHQGSM